MEWRLSLSEELDERSDSARSCAVLLVRAQTAERSRSPRPSSRPSGSAKPKVIYVMGQPKSGSTILGVALGNCAGVFFAGELSNWLATSGRPIIGGSERTRFWQDVGRGVNGGDELFGCQAFQCLERGASVYRVDRWRARRRLREQYRRVMGDLYLSIANRAGAKHIVDSSHLPLRARELQSVNGIELYLIFLVRNIEGIVASHTRYVKRHEVAERRRRFLGANVRLWWTYLLSVIIFLRHPRDRRLVVRHEHFVANPEGVMREILQFADSSAEIPDLRSLSTGIPLNGNRLLRSKVVALKAEPAPPHRPSRLMRAAQRPWNLILGRLQPAAKGNVASDEHARASVGQSRGERSSPRQLTNGGTSCLN